jgi:hypothetical protein
MPPLQLVGAARFAQFHFEDYAAGVATVRVVAASIVIVVAAIIAMIQAYLRAHDFSSFVC